MATNQLKISYRGSWFWLILWLILFFPIAIALFFTSWSFTSQQKVHHFHYNGSRFWLCFWLLFFFPISIILFLVNGVVIDTHPIMYPPIDPKL